MSNITIYLKLKQNIEVTNPDVFLKDLGQIESENKGALAKLKAIKVYKFGSNMDKRAVISVLKVIELIHEAIPGTQVENLSETESVIEFVKERSSNDFTQILKIWGVCLISFFGTAFTIMAFHNDIGIHRLFSKIFELVMGYESDGYSVLELSYSMGLALGIILFFNHIGGRRITKDPTPIEVEMRIYEQDVNTTLVENAEREHKTIDVK